MNELLESVIEAHGGLGRWKNFQKVRAAIVTGGALFSMKGLPQDAAKREMTVSLHEQWASVAPNDQTLLEASEHTLNYARASSVSSTTFVGSKPLMGIPK